MSSLGGFRGAALGKKGAVDAFLGNGHVLAPARKVKSLTVRGVAALLVWRRLLWRGRRGGHGRIVRRRKPVAGTSGEDGYLQGRSGGLLSEGRGGLRYEKADLRKKRAGGLGGSFAYLSL